MKWRIDSGGSFYDPEEENVVYFDRASGNTHLVNRLAGYLIQRLIAIPEPVGTGELMALVLEELEIEDSPELADTIADILDELASLGIVTQE